MRRAFTILTALTAVSVLGACTTDDESSEDNGSAVSEETDAEDDETMATEDAMGDDAEETEAAMGDDAGETGAAMGGESMGDPVCDEFFAGQGTPLAERADAQREVLAPGDDLDSVSFSEVTLLSGRITTLVETAEGDQAALLERINAPFQEVNDAVIEDGTRLEEEIEIPEVDVEDSATAQDELLAACEG